MTSIYHIIKDNDARTKGTTLANWGKPFHDYDQYLRSPFGVKYGKNVNDRSNALGNSQHHSEQHHSKR